MSSEAVLDLVRLPKKVKLASKALQDALLGQQKASETWVKALENGMSKESMSLIVKDCLYASNKSKKASDSWMSVGLLMGDKHEIAELMALDIIVTGLSWTKCNYSLTLFLESSGADKTVQIKQINMVFVLAFIAFDRSIRAINSVEDGLEKISATFPGINAEVPALASTAACMLKNSDPLLKIQAVAAYVHLTSKLDGCFA